LKNVSTKIRKKATAGIHGSTVGLSCIVNFLPYPAGGGGGGGASAGFDLDASPLGDGADAAREDIGGEGSGVNL
jgi:hypothetical protein